MKEQLGIYIIEDDETMIELLSDIIEEQNLGMVLGSCAGESLEPEELRKLRPDMILVDFLMPGKDGTEVVRELKAQGLTAKFIMISQVSSKEMIGRAYDAGVDFYINKPLNLIEVASVISNVTMQIRNERTIDHLRSMFIQDMRTTEQTGDTLRREGRLSPSLKLPPEPPRFPEASPGKDKKAPKSEEGTASQEENDFCRKLSAILTRIGMAGERGSADILRLCRYLKEQNTTTAQRNIRDLCMELSKHPKSMEQRMRRAIQTGMNSLAHLGIEDYMNEVFTEYSSTLFSFEEVRREMDFLREKRECGGKSSVKKFIDGLMLLSENNEQLF